jgi:hypothetical protein
MAMADAAYADASHEIDIAIPVLVDQRAAGSLRHRQS